MVLKIFRDGDHFPDTKQEIFGSRAWAGGCRRPGPLPRLAPRQRVRRKNANALPNDWKIRTGWKNGGIDFNGWAVKIKLLASLTLVVCGLFLPLSLSHPLSLSFSLSLSLSLSLSMYQFTCVCVCVARACGKAFVSK